MLLGPPRDHSSEVEVPFRQPVVGSLVFQRMSFPTPQRHPAVSGWALDPTNCDMRQQYR